MIKDKMAWLSVLMFLPLVPGIYMALVYDTVRYVSIMGGFFLILYCFMRFIRWNERRRGNW